MANQERKTHEIIAAGEKKKQSLSYWHSPDEQPLQWLTIPHLIDEWAEKTPQQEAYVVRMQGRTREAVTFGQLKQQTEQLAAGLLELGLSAGDFVLITGITCMNWIIVDLACASIGISTIRCRMSVLTKEGLLTILNSNNVKALFYHPGEAGELSKHLRRCLPDAFKPANKSTILQCAEVVSLKHVISLSDDGPQQLNVDELKTSEQAALDHIRAVKAKVQPDDIATVYMTSGSTGFPKAIPYSHFHNVNAWRRMSCISAFIQPTDCFFSDRSLAWAGALFYNPLQYGCCNVYVHPLTAAAENDVQFCIKVIHEEQVTCGFLLQYLISDIMNLTSQGKAELFRLRWATVGGEVIVPKTIEALSSFCDEITLVYATTESLCMASLIGKDKVKNNIQYTGRVEKGSEIKIVNEAGEVVPLGQEGEIVVRSPFAFHGYLQSESKGMGIDPNGWINTGDGGCLEEGGMLKVFGRKTNVISRGITLTYPIVVERAIVQCPGVEAVAVIGVPDKRLGENICACIIPEASRSSSSPQPLTSDTMLRYFDELYQTDEGLGMTPGYFLFLKQFPTVNGKVDRKALRSMAIEELNIE